MTEIFDVTQTDPSLLIADEQGINYRSATNVMKTSGINYRSDANVMTTYSIIYMSVSNVMTTFSIN